MNNQDCWGRWMTTIVLLILSYIFSSNIIELKERVNKLEQTIVEGKNEQPRTP